MIGSTFTPQDRPFLNVLCTRCNARVSVYSDGRPFTSIERASAFIIAWARGKGVRLQARRQSPKGVMMQAKPEAPAEVALRPKTIHRTCPACTKPVWACASFCPSCRFVLVQK